MKSVFIPLLAIILFSTLVLNANINLKNLWDESDDMGESFLVKDVVKDWISRSTDFSDHTSSSEEEWQKIFHLFTIDQISSINLEDFKSSPAAYTALAKHLSRHLFNNTATVIPFSIRPLVYDLQGRVNVEEAAKITNHIPATWVEKDGVTIMQTVKRFNPPLLGALNDKALAKLFKNTNGECAMIDFDMINSLKANQLKLMEPTCMEAVKGLNEMDLSRILAELPVNIFATFNGSLSEGTIWKLSGDQINAYGSLVKGETCICKFLDLHYLNPSAISFVTARCLYGYLSRECGQGIGHLWSGIPSGTLEQFSPEMRFAWQFIHPGDYKHMRPSVIKVLLSSESVCSTIKGFSLNLRIMEEIPSSCLYSMIVRPGKPFKLGKLWKGVPPKAMSDLSNESFAIFLRHVSVEDFLQMPLPILNLIFNSEIALANLPHPVESIFLPPDHAKLLTINRRQFASIAKVAPSVAGQLLMILDVMDFDILADCDGQTIRSLTWFDDSGNTVGWEALFAKLEGRKQKWFKLIVANMSIKTGRHFCSTIMNLSDYLVLHWLRKNTNNNCLSVIPFDKSTASVFLEAPELVQGLPWRKMLARYTLNDWTKIFSNDRTATLLGKKCQFWTDVASRYRQVLIHIHRLALKRITPDCVKKLKSILVYNTHLIPHLSDNAFSTHLFGELPCPLHQLTPKQISTLSKTAISKGSLSSQNFPRHCLSTTTLKDLVLLDFKQAIALITSQLLFLQDNVKIQALNWYLEASTIHINTFTTKVYKDHATDSNESNYSQSLESFKDALELYGTIRERYATLTSFKLNFNEIFTVIREANQPETFSKALRNYSIFKPLVISLLGSPEELRDYLQESISNMMMGGYGLRRFEVEFSEALGFSRSRIIEIILSKPEVLASPEAYIVAENIADHGGPMRILVSQILTDIKQDLVVAGPKIGQTILINNQDQKGSFNRKDDPQTSMDGTTTTRELSSNHQVDTTVGNTLPGGGSAKFIWGIGQQAGFIAGVVFGKALQLDIRLPFSLDPAFYALIFDPREELIERYYNAAYKNDRYEFESYIFSLYEQDTFSREQLEETLTRIECLRFAKLCTRVKDGKVGCDPESRSNIRSCGIDEGFEGESQLTDKVYLEAYLKSHHESVLSEFKKFTREFIRGIGYSIPLFKEIVFMGGEPFSIIPYPPVVEYLSILLNQRPIIAKDIIKRIRFENDKEIDGFIEGQTIKASSVVHAFINSLEGEQLEYLIAIWTGASTFSLEYNVGLNVEFSTDSDVQPFNFNYCKRQEQMMERLDHSDVIAPGQQYLTFFKKVMEKLYGPEMIIIKPKCPLEGIPITLIHVSTCNQSLEIVLRPAQELFNSLVDMINTRLTTIRDS